MIGISDLIVVNVKYSILLNIRKTNPKFRYFYYADTEIVTFYYLVI